MDESTAKPDSIEAGVVAGAREAQIDGDLMKGQHHPHRQEEELKRQEAKTRELDARDDLGRRRGQQHTGNHDPDTARDRVAGTRAGAPNVEPIEHGGETPLAGRVGPERTVPKP